VDLSEIGRIEKALRSEDDVLNNAIMLSLSGTSDAKAIEKLSAIEVVTKTPPDIKAAAKAFAEPASAIPAEPEADDDIEVGLEVRTADRSAAPAPEAAAALAAALVRLKTPEDAKEDPQTGGSMEGGVYRSAGTVAITFEAHNGSWDFLPPPTDPVAVTAAVQQAIEARHSPSTIVAYISSVPGIKEKHDIVKSSAVFPTSLHYFMF
jgi:hypothetical protein